MNNSKSNRSIRSGISIKSNRSGLSRKSGFSNRSSVSIGKKNMKNKDFELMKKISTENQFILKNISRYKAEKLPAYIKGLSRNVNS